MRLFSHHNLFKLSLALLSIAGYGLFVFAAAPTGGYIPGQTNDPSCAPGDTDCVVNLYITTATNHTWVGNSAGQNGGSTNNTVFIGIGAGDGATSANYSNFVGTGAGQNAVNANNSNFFGQLAGCNATNADNANFFGQLAGCYATNANNSNFFGYRSGYGATNADHSTFFGDETGESASSAYSSVFIGASAGYGATNAYQSNFFGREAGYAATGASDSSFLGYQAGYQATNATGSFFAGNQAGYQAYGADTSVMIGNQAGYNNTGTVDFLTGAGNPYGISGGANFLGYQAGYGAEGAVQTTFIGTQAGYQAVTALGSTIIGFMSGYNAIPATFASPTLGASIIIGANAGRDTVRSNNNIVLGNGAIDEITDSFGSIFIGQDGIAGDSSYIAESVVIGSDSGQSMDHVVRSVIIGPDSGDRILNANYSVIIGSDAGGSSDFQNTLTHINYAMPSGSFQLNETVRGSLSNSSVNVLSDDGTRLGINSLYSFFIPGETITGQDSGATAVVGPVTPGSSNILIGSNTFTNGYINSIALGAGAFNFKTNQMVIGSTLYPINEVYIQQAGTSCTIDNTGLTCSSDQTLKTNITALPSVLDTLTQVQAVTYNWNTDPNGKRMIGFLAQDLEQYFPQLVSQGPDGKKSVNYANMTPVLVQAIRELDLKLDSIESRAADLNPTLKQSLMSWLGDRANGISAFFADSINARNRVCIDDVCVTKDDLQRLVSERTGQSAPSGDQNTPPNNSDNSNQGDSQENPAPSPENPENTGSNGESGVSEAASDTQPESNSGADASPEPSSGENTLNAQGENGNSSESGGNETPSEASVDAPAV